MRFPKQVQLNRLIFVGLVVFALIGIAFLGLVIFTIISPNSGTHSHPHPHDDESHPHPHDDESHLHAPDEIESPTAEGSTGAETIREVPDGKKNVTNTEEGSEATSPRHLEAKDVLAAGSKGILAAFQPAIDLRDIDPKLANEKMHAIAEELGGGDPEWTEYFHLTGHGLLGALPGTMDAYLPIDDGVRYYALKDKLFGLTDKDKQLTKEIRAMVKWNTDRVEVLRQTEPIRNTLAWMKENAPDEWEVVNKHFQESLSPLNPPPGPPSENPRTIEQRVDDHYESFVKGLNLLLEDSVTLQALFESTSPDEVQESLLSERRMIQAEPALPAPPKPKTPKHTWDVTHKPLSPIDAAADEKSGETRVDSTPPPEVPQPPEAERVADIDAMFSTDARLKTELRERFSPERFNRALETLRQHGPTEGLRRLKEMDPGVASEIEKMFQTSQ